MDPLAEKYRKWSPYNFTVDNPTGNTDPDGMGPCPECATFNIKVIKTFVKSALAIPIGLMNWASDNDRGGHLKHTSKEYEELQTQGLKNQKELATNLLLAYAGGKVFEMAAESFGGKGPFIGAGATEEATVLSRGERLVKFKEKIANADDVSDPNQALKLINKTLKNIEDKYAGANDRMYGVLDDKFKTYHEDGSVTALTKGQRIEIKSDGDFTIYNRKDGSVFLKKISKKE